MNKLLFENRDLSKDNIHKAKLNKYGHKLYPINFYDIPGFGQNEEREMTNSKNYINQFNTQYEKIKNKIHIIFYLFNYVSARLLQDNEVELINIFLTYNIPIYFIGNKSNL
jgi:GTP-binding protein EngB required for normal cell division